MSSLFFGLKKKKKSTNFHIFFKYNQTFFCISSIGLVLFNSVSIIFSSCPWGRDSHSRLWEWLNTWDLQLDRWDGQHCFSHIDSQSQEEGHSMSCRVTWGCPWNTVDEQQLWKAGFVVSRECLSFFPPWEKCDCLIWSMVWQKTEKPSVLRDKQELHLVVLIRRVVWLGDFMHMSGGEEVVATPFETLLISTDVKASYSVGLKC